MTDTGPGAGGEAQVENDAAGRWQRLTWRLTPDALRAALSGGAASRATRAPRRSAAQSVLLLSDVLVLEGELLATNILARSEPAGDGLSLEVLVTTEREVPPGLVCQLTTVARTHAVPLSGASATFSNVRPAEIEGGLTIRLERTPATP